MAIDLTDHGPNPWVVDVEELTVNNDKFRSTQWTGQHLQMTVMSIKVGGEVGLEAHDGIDQFLRIEKGSAKVMMGATKDNLDKTWDAGADFAIFVPAGTWHNIVNIGEEELKLYSIYTPPEHAHDTVHETFEESEAAHDH